MKPVVMGLDLSLTAPAAVVLPARWRPGTWRMPSACWAAKIALFVHEERERADFEPARWALLSNWVLDFARVRGATHVFVEDYAFAARRTAGRALAEFGGVVKYNFWNRQQIVVQPVVAASARKTLLGHVPSKKTSGVEVKDYVNEKLARMGAKFATMDEGDAFIVANHGRYLLGLPYIGVDP